LVVVDDASPSPNVTTVVAPRVVDSRVAHMIQALPNGPGFRRRRGGAGYSTNSNAGRQPKTCTIFSSSALKGLVAAGTKSGGMTSPTTSDPSISEWGDKSLLALFRPAIDAACREYAVRCPLPPSLSLSLSFPTDKSLG
jgi:hypothetical protein